MAGVAQNMDPISPDFSDFGKIRFFRVRPPEVLEGFFVPVLILYFLNSECIQQYAQLRLVSLICLWSARLALLLFARFFLRSRIDGRNNEMRSKGGLFVYWFGVMAWGLVCCFPFTALLYFNCGKKHVPFGSSNGDIIGSFLFVFGFVMESVADLQKLNAYRLNPKGQRFNLGFFYTLTRNPNFAGEFLLWLGLAIIAASDLSHSVWAQVLIFCSPALTLYAMLAGTAANIAEANNASRHGGFRDYEAYRHTTSMFFPVPRFIYTRLPSVIRKTILMDWETWRGLGTSHASKKRA